MFPGGKPPLEDFISSWYPILIAIGFGVIVAIRSYFKGCPNPSEEMLEGKVAVVTGANSGMGKEISMDLARRGCKVYMACRDMEAGKNALEEIKTKVNKAKLIVLYLDMEKISTIYEFVTAFKKDEEKLDLLVNNAGVMGRPKTETVDKNDMMFQVNYLGTFVLTQLLLDSLLAAEKSRIINTACHAYRIGNLALGDLNLNNIEEYKSGEMYAQSKLAVVLFTRKLAKYLEGTNVTVNAVSPGVVNTPLYRDMPWQTNSFFKYSFFPVTWMFMKAAKDGAQTTLYCLVAKEEEGVSGKLYNECKIVPFEGQAADEDLAEKLWEESFLLTKLKPKQLKEN